MGVSLLYNISKEIIFTRKKKTEKKMFVIRVLMGFCYLLQDV